MVAPCRYCEKRELGCHGKCEEYQAFAKERDRINQEKYDDWESKRMVTKWVERNQKRKARGR